MDLLLSSSGIETNATAVTEYVNILDSDEEAELSAAEAQTAEGTARTRFYVRKTVCHAKEGKAPLSAVTAEAPKANATSEAEALPKTTPEAPETPARSEQENESLPQQQEDDKDTHAPSENAQNTVTSLADSEMKMAEEENAHAPGKLPTALADSEKGTCEAVRAPPDNSDSAPLVVPEKIPDNVNAQAQLDDPGKASTSLADFEKTTPDDGNVFLPLANPDNVPMSLADSEKIPDDISAQAQPDNASTSLVDSEKKMLDEEEKTRAPPNNVNDAPASLADSEKIPDDVNAQGLPGNTVIAPLADSAPAEDAQNETKGKVQFTRDTT